LAGGPSSSVENLIKDGEVAEKAASPEIAKQGGSIKGKPARARKILLPQDNPRSTKARGRVSGKWNELEEAFDSV